jgi:hypothetical protein
VTRVTDELPGPSSAEAEPQIARRGFVLGSIAFFLAMPAVLGGLGSLVPVVLYPDGKMPMATRLDNLVISVFAWSALLVLLSPPATLFGAMLGVWAAKRAGWKTAFSRTLLAVLAAGVGLTAANYWIAWTAMQRHPEFRHGIPPR